MPLYWLGIQDQHVSLGTLILMLVNFVPLWVCLLLEVNCWNVSFWFGGIEYESISLLRLSFAVDLHLAAALHLLPLNIGQMVLKWLGVKDQIIARGMAFGFEYGVK